MVLEQGYLGFGGGVDEREKLPVVDRLSLAFEFGLEGIRKRQIHIVAAQKNMFSNTDAFEFQSPLFIGYGNQAEIGGSAANITDEDDISWADLGTPLSTCLLDPGVE